MSAAGHFSSMATGVFSTAPYGDLPDPVDRLLGYVDFRKAILQGGLPEFTCLLGTMVQEAYETHPPIREACDIAADGSLSNRRVWADLDGGFPDGICLDADNAVWYGDVPHKRCVRVREGGEVLQTSNLDRDCFACTLGGADKRTLFLMAAEWRGPAKMADGARTGQVITVEDPARGVGWP